MADSNLGTATIVYDHPEDGTVEQTVQNEHLVYVDRNVETFEDEIGTVRRQVENVASDIRSKLLGGDDAGGDIDERQPSDPVEIDVTDDSDDRNGTED